MRHFVAMLMRNTLTITGSAITTASATLIAGLFLMQTWGAQESPYLGLLTFIALPAVFVVGLLMIPLGLWLQRRRDRRAVSRGETLPAYPVLNLNVERTQKAVLAFFVLTSLNLVILGVSSYKGVEVMDSTRFCGATCHSVMEPEFTTYQRSPHSRVACVSCHIGPGAGWFVRSKLSGSWQLVSVAMKLYPKPIPTPVHNLRPARETCEQCHWPSKFVGDRLKVITHYGEDEKSSPKKTVLLLHVGGLQATTSRGIHWHVDPRVRIRYRSDPTRENISEIELTREDGKIETFTAPAKDKAAGTSAGDPASATSGEGPEWRTMDCVDCHNRPSHIYKMPEDELDASLESGRVDAGLPFIRREALKALRVAYPSHEQARESISAQIHDFYRKTYPDLASSQASSFDGAAQEIGQIYATNVFPSMNITWGTYPSHLGHTNSPGCFRCHDEEHKTADGRVISQDCTKCHTVLAMDEESPDILKQLHP
jgi:nitrate/TMAO reductase-like tetraheme cytochrome c subunit